MPELAVVPAALVDIAHSLAVSASGLRAVSAALPSMTADVGPSDIAHALEDAAHVWQHALRGLAFALDSAGQRLVSAATAYDGVEAVVADWADR